MVFKDSNVQESGTLFKRELEYVESVDAMKLVKGAFSDVFSAYKRQSAGVIKEFKSKLEYRSRSERRKLKAEIARKRNARRNRGNRYVGYRDCC